MMARKGLLRSLARRKTLRCGQKARLQNSERPAIREGSVPGGEDTRAAPCEAVGLVAQELSASHVAGCQPRAYFGRPTVRASDRRM
jgi:hypothetical protein